MSTVILNRKTLKTKQNKTNNQKKKNKTQKTENQISWEYEDISKATHSATTCVNGGLNSIKTTRFAVLVSLVCEGQLTSSAGEASSQV